MRIAATALLDHLPGAPALGEDVGRLAARSLIRELELTPKPGLVDRVNSGAHHDMGYATFRASVTAIAPWFPEFFYRGIDGAAVAAEDFLPWIRNDGKACERAMLCATGGVNTHKGSVFSFGLLCAAAGRLHGRGDVLEREALCTEVARICTGLVEREFVTPAAARTAGERLYWQHGLRGARGEAQSGFATARAHGVTPYVEARERGWGDERAMYEALLHLMAHNQDTNVVSRGGLAGLAFVQAGARRLLDGPSPPAPLRARQLAVLDAAMIRRNLSPGGSADLLAVTWFLANLGDLDPRLVASAAHAERPPR